MWSAFVPGHPWVYRSDVRTAQAEPGAIVRVTDERGRFQGRAFYSDKSQIAIRLLTREDIAVDRAFFTQRLQRAAAYRQTVVEDTDATDWFIAKRICCLRSC